MAIHIVQAVARLGPLYQRGFNTVRPNPVVGADGAFVHGHWCLSIFEEELYRRYQCWGFGAVLVAGNLGLALYNIVYLVSEREYANAALGLAVLNRAVCRAGSTTF